MIGDGTSPKACMINTPIPTASERFSCGTLSRRLKFIPAVGAMSSVMPTPSMTMKKALFVDSITLKDKVEPSTIHTRTWMRLAERTERGALSPRAGSASCCRRSSMRWVQRLARSRRRPPMGVPMMPPMLTMSPKVRDASFSSSKKPRPITNAGPNVANPMMTAE
eukprot:scaffold1875_cov253-Pinguiococcus_pyrenoidosus.AAC.17